MELTPEETLDLMGKHNPTPRVEGTEVLNLISGTQDGVTGDKLPTPSIGDEIIIKPGI